MGWRILTTVVLAAHFAFLAYVVLGGFVAWRWPRSIWAHAVAAGWGLLIAFHVVECPLTYAEDWSRRQAGEVGSRSGFIDRYIEGVLYPERFTVALQVLVGVSIAGSWVGFALRRHRARQRAVTTKAVADPPPGGDPATGAGSRPADTSRKTEESSGHAATV